MNLPSEFISIVTNTFGEEGEQLIENLPILVEEASSRWGLRNVQPVDNLSYNFVAFALSGVERSRSAGLEVTRPSSTDFAKSTSSSAQDVVLKIGVPRDELTSEIAALRLFNGEGACRLIDADEEKGFLLLERLNPGVMLSTMEDDEQATHIGAEVMQKIWRDVPLESWSLLPHTRQQAVGFQNQFIQLSDWFDGLKRLRERYNGRTGPLNEKLVDRVEQSAKDFFAENHKPVLMHGDFHHFNILSSERGWLVIDPKGVIGPAGYEVGPFLINPWGDLLNGTNYRRMIKRRIEILHERLGFERERIHAWCLAHAILSAWWSIEDNTGWEYALAFAEMIADLRFDPYKNTAPRAGGCI
jgi:streptomycin 6-kinase